MDAVQARERLILGGSTAPTTSEGSGRAKSRCRSYPLAGAPTVHFEAPHSKRVPAEMKQFISWFNRTRPLGKEPLPAITRTGAAHLFFESIHPFEDEYRRIGRAIAEKAMTESFGQPVLVSLATTILGHRKSYYQTLERANRRSILQNGSSGLLELCWMRSGGASRRWNSLSPRRRCWTGCVITGERKHARYKLNLSKIEFETFFWAAARACKT